MSTIFLPIKPPKAALDVILEYYNLTVIAYFLRVFLREEINRGNIRDLGVEAKMLLKRKHSLEDAISLLERALAKARMAKNIVESSRGNVDKLLVLSAFSGFPISSQAMASVYLTSSMKDVGKALKILMKAYRKIDGVGLAKVIDKLRNLVNASSSEEYEETLENVVSELRDLMGKIGNLTV